MSCTELINSLKRSADERIRKIRQETEEKAAAVRAESARRLLQLREDVERSRAASRQENTSAAVADAGNKARFIKLAAEQKLSRRLYVIAAAALPALRARNYEALFARLAEELPSLQWKSVRVNAADSALARKYFPGAEIVQDGAVTGGMDVSTSDGAIRISNTFEKRLERAWPDMIPGLINDVRREVDDETPSISPEPGLSDRVSLIPD